MKVTNLGYVMNYNSYFSQVTTILVFSVVAMMNYQLTATCSSYIPAKVAPILECIPNLQTTCLGEEVKCLRNQHSDLQLSRLTGTWDNRDTFFIPELARANATYQNRRYTPCPWRYEEQYNVNRYPRYIHNVNCHSPICYDNTGHGMSLDKCTCKEVKYTMPTLWNVTCNSGQCSRINSTIVNVACVPHFTQ